MFLTVENEVMKIIVITAIRIIMIVMIRMIITKILISDNHIYSNDNYADCNSINNIFLLKISSPVNTQGH